MATVQKPGGYALKGYQDISWLICSHCGGNGQISQELAIDRKGLKGDWCAVCNGVGRIPDPAWPTCGCAGNEAKCPVCFGLGLLSPMARETLANRIKAAKEAADQAQAHFQALLKAAQAK